MTNHRDMENQQLKELCRELAPQILAQRGWALVQDEAAFIDEVIAETRAR